MKKLTLASIREPLNLLLNFEISQSRFVEMLNECVGLETETETENNDDILETNSNIIYIENTALNIFTLDKFEFHRIYNDIYTISERDYIRVDIDKKEYITIETDKDNIKNIVSIETLFNIINK